MSENPGHAKIAAANERVYTNMLARRGAIREILEANFGVPLTMKDVGHMLADRGFANSYTTIREDFTALNIERVEAHLHGKKTRFYVYGSHSAHGSPEDIRRGVPSDVIENEAYKEMLQCVVDVFTDGKRVVILTAYERAKHLALWLKNVAWPEIWYLSKEDGSTIIVETRSVKRAEFLKTRLWGFREKDIKEESA